MNRSALFTVIPAACLLAASALAGGRADKVTGEFIQGTCADWACQPGDDFDLPYVTHRWVTAHEALNGHPQQGYVFSLRDDGIWYEISLNDPAYSCVHVEDDGWARIGGLVIDGNGPQVGRYFGLLVEDQGGPAYFADHCTSYRMSADYWSETARLDLLDWCSTGALPADLPANAIWPGMIFVGNLKIHNSPKDGD